jgi:hypothetical protein
MARFILRALDPVHVTACMLAVEGANEIWNGYIKGPGVSPEGEESKRESN